MSCKSNLLLQEYTFNCCKDGQKEQSDGRDPQDTTRQRSRCLIKNSTFQSKVCLNVGIRLLDYSETGHNSKRSSGSYYQGKSIAKARSGKVKYLPVSITVKSG